MSIFSISSLLKKTLLVSVIIFAPLLVPAPAEAVEIGGQLVDGNCGSGFGTKRYVTPSDWSSSIFDADHWGSDCYRIYLDNTGSETIPEDTDVRLHIRLVEVYNCGWLWLDECYTIGTPQNTPWASEGGGWSPWASHNDLAIDGMRIRVQTRDMPAEFANSSVGDIQLSLQAADVFGASGCWEDQGSIKSTPVNYGWTAWTTDGDAIDPNCLRIKLEVSMLPTEAPMPSLLVQVNGEGFVDSASVDVFEEDQVDLQWSATNDPDTCVGSASDGDTSFTTGDAVSGTSTDVTIPTAGSSRTFTVACANVLGTSTDAVIVTTTAGAATVDVFDARVDGGAWSANNRVDGNAITYGETVELRWEADADACNGSNFSAGGATDGGPLVVTSPFAGETVQYTLLCTRSGQDSDSKSISIEAVESAPILTASETLVRESDTVTLEWDLNGNDPASCSLTGASVDVTPAAQTGSEDVVMVQGQAKYVLDCAAGGSDEVNINVRPDISES